MNAPAVHEDSHAQSQRAVDVDSERGSSPKLPERVRSLRVRLHEMQGAGPRVPLGIEPLDVLMRGGMRAEKLLVLGGAPGAGKTTLLMQIARNLVRKGVAVGVLAADEEPAGLDVRNMQAVGIPRDEAEEPDDDTVGKALRLMGDWPLWIFDGALNTVEDVFVDLAELYPNQPRAVLLDSLQTVRTTMTEDIEAIRERINDVVATAKRLARNPLTRAIVVCTSELARGSYRSKKSSEQTNDLASFKESGAVEYGAHVALVLRTVPGQDELVEATVAKNRLGRRGDFALRMSFTTATFVAEAVDVLAEDAAEDEATKLTRAKVLSVVAENPGASSRAIVQLVGGNAKKVYDALSYLEVASEIQNTGTERAKKWRVLLVLPSASKVLPEADRFCASRPIGAEALSGSTADPVGASVMESFA